MQRCLVVSLTLLAACGVDAPDEAGSAEQAVTDNPIVSQTQRVDGAFDVTCADGAVEIDTSEQISAGLACVPARTAVAHFTTMQETYSSSLYSSVGYPDRWGDVRVKLIGGAVSAVFFDTWATAFTHPLTADLVPLSADGSFTATGYTAAVTGCLTSYLSRDEAWVTIVGRVAANNTVTISSVKTRAVRSSATRQGSGCTAWTWYELSRTWFDSTQPAPPATLSP
jgi:hypothetical protein